MQGVIYAMNIAIFIAVILGLLFIMRWKYQRDVNPSKEFPHGKIIAEFWTTAGPRYRQPVGVLTNGLEIAAPSGHKTPRYFFTKASMGMTKYPLQPMLPFSFVQIDVPMVSWYQDNPEPIPATLAAARIGEKVMTAELLDLARSTETLATVQAVNDEMAKTQQELQKALTERLNKNIVYLMGILSAGGGIAAAIIGYMTYKIISAWGTGGG